MLTGALILIVATTVSILLSLLGGIRAFTWSATALGTIGLIHAAIVIAFDVNGVSLDYRFAHSRLLLATVPASIILFLAGLVTFGMACYQKRRLTSGCS